MARVYLILAGIFFLIVPELILSVESVAEGKHWPDFSCHPVNNTYVHRNAMKINRVDWASCVETQDKYKGNCAKVCMLLNDQIISVEDVKGPVIFNATKFINYFGSELGGGVGQIEVYKKITPKLEDCKKNHPEIKKLLQILKAECNTMEQIHELY